MATTTTNFGFTLPSVNSPTDENLWGGQLNGNWTALDALLLTASDNVSRVTTGTDSITATDQNKIILANATSAAFAETLPAASSVANGFMVIIKKTDSSGNAVTVTPNGADTIEGLSTFVLSAQYAYVAIISDHVSNWNIVSQTAAAVNTATSSTLGIVKPDNSSITISAGVLTAPNRAIPTAASNGKVVLGAVTIQWFTASASTGTFATSFPTTFSGAAYNIICTGLETTGRDSYISVTSGTVTSSGFSAVGQDNGQMFCLAIGPT